MTINTFIGRENTWSPVTKKWYYVKILDTYVSYDSDVANKSKTANFAKAKACGVLPVLPYSRTIQSGGSFCMVEGTTTLVGPSWDPCGDRADSARCFTSTPVSVASVLALYPTQRGIAGNEAKARFASRIENVQVSTIVEVGEGRESLALIANTLKHLNVFSARERLRNQRLLREIWRKIRTSANDPKELYRRANDLTNMYLEFNYGWKPIYGTLCSAIEVFAGAHGRPRTKVSGKGVFEDTAQSETAWTNLGSTYAAGLVRFMNNRNFKYQVWYGGLLDQDNCIDLRSQLGLNVGDIIPALWDLLKFSFVFDYFVNIGDVLGNLRQSYQRMSPTTLYCSQKIEYEQDKLLTGWKPYSPGHGYSYQGRGSVINSGSYKVTYFSRVPVSGSGCLVTLNLVDPSWASINKTLALAFANFNGHYMKK